MNQQEFASLLTTIIEDCFIELVKHHNCFVKKSDARPQTYSQSLPIAYIDAGSKDFEILLSISLPLHIVEKLYPMQSDQVLIDEGILEDWLKELSNLLIGWIKIQLENRNCRIQIGLPDFLHEASAREIHPQDSQCFTTYFDVEHEYCECSFSLQFFSEDIHCDAIDDPSIVGDINRSGVDLF